MKFEVARKRLSRLAKGRYHSISYEESYFENNPVPDGTCGLYIEKVGSVFAPAWIEALKKMKEAIGEKLTVIKKRPKNEAPREEKKSLKAKEGE